MMGQIGGEGDVLGWNEGLLREVLWVLGWIGGDGNVFWWKEELLSCSEDISGYSEEL